MDYTPLPPERFHIKHAFNDRNTRETERIYGARSTLVHAIQHPEAPRAVTRSA